MYMIHKKTGNLHQGFADKLVPLLWEMDADTLDRLNINVAMVYAFPCREDAENVMAEVPTLFDHPFVDKDGNSILCVVEYTPT